MKKGLITYSIFAAMTAFAVMSCADDAEQYIDGGADGVFRLASGQEAFTRATESTGTTFDEGTKYQLYAIVGTDFSKNYLKDPAGPGAVEGTETVNHTIGGKLANKFNNKTLNFYGVTNSTDTPVTINDKNGIPTSYIAYEANKSLTDVMWAKKENQTNKNSGTITLPFGHTLSKLNLYVLKGADYKDTPILKAIRLMDYAEGNLSMATGQYESQANDQRNYWVSVLSGANQTVTTTAELVTSAGQAVAPMIFPTRRKGTNDIKNHALQVEVTVTVKGKETKQTTQITSLLAEDPQAPEVPFNFESNHEYDMVITVTEQSLVVTIVPRVYDWIPVEEIKPDPDVNGSMTIGGITWMDRNLGASSGDPLASDQDWENSRGYYYQFGRNIPFYIKTKKDEFGTLYAPSNGNWHLPESEPYPFIPGHEEDGPKGSYSSKVATYPTDSSKDFNFIYSTPWSSNSSKNWQNPNDQPCPKGWRLPTEDEFKLIIPGSEKAGDIPFRVGDHKDKNTYIEKVYYDPESNDSTIYVGVKSGTHAETTVGITNSIYALKRQGTNHAYYLRWHVERSSVNEIPNANNVDKDKGDQRRSVLVISRYPATSKSTLTEENVKDAAKWSNPVEEIRLPFSGYIHCGKQSSTSSLYRPALIYSGCEAVYWTSTPHNSVRMKFAGDDLSNQIMMYGTEDHNNGCLIRCVRDTQAK